MDLSSILKPGKFLICVPLINSLAVRNASCILLPLYEEIFIGDVNVWVVQGLGDRAKAARAL